MKKAIYALVILAAFSYHVPFEKETILMPGAYKMLSQSVTIGTKDSAITGAQQLKIYTPDFMMYANVTINGTDISSAFGIGSYTTNGGKVTENVIYSASDSSVSASSSSFSLDVTKTTKGYKQVIPDIGESQGQKIKLIEEYEKMGSVARSPLDGSWKEVKAYTITGKDTVPENSTQYKIYYAGHFIWGHTYKDAATNKNGTGIGFGTFKMNGSNKSSETVMASTYSIIYGQTLNFDIKMNGKDEYQQTNTTSDGRTRVELYQRVKK